MAQKYDGSVIIDSKIDSSGVETGIKNINSSISGLEGSLKKFGGVLAGAFAVSKVMEFKDACFDLAVEAESAFAKVGTIVSYNGEDFEQYTKEITKFSNKTGVSVADYSEAVYQAVSASVDEAEAIEFVNDAFQLAKGGFTDITTATDTLTTVMNAYGESAGDARNISNKLITVQNKGKTSVAELGASMGKIIPTAAAYGVNLDNLGAAYIATTKSGIATAESTTYINSMLNELASSSNGAGEVLSGLGVSFSDVMNNGGDLYGVLNTLYESVGQDTTAFANLWSSAEAGKAALAIVNGGAEEFTGSLDSMANSAGVTEEAFATMSSTTEEKMQIIKTNLQNMMIGIGDYLVEASGPLLDLVIKYLPVVQEAVADLADKFFHYWGLIKDVVGQKIGEIWGVVNEFLPIISQLFTDAFGLVKGAWETILLPVFTTIDGIIRDTILPTVQTVFTDTIVPTIQNAFTAIKGFWDNTLKPVFDSIIDMVANNIMPTITETLENTIVPLFETSFELIQSYWDNILKPVFDAVWKLFGDVCDYIEERIPVVIDFFSGFFKDLGELWEGVVELYELLWEQNLKPNFEKIGDYLETYLYPIFSAVFENGIAPMIDTVFGGIRDAWDNILYPVFSGLIDFLKNVFVGDWEGAWESVANTFSNVFSCVLESGKDIINSLIGIINGAIGGIESALNWVIGSVNSIGDIKIPDWIPGIGGQGFSGFNIPPVSFGRIPLLAQGAVIPPNAEFMAILGDQKNGQNLEAPEGLIRQIMREELAEKGGGNYHFTATINRRVLYDEFIAEQRLRQAQNGMA